MNGISQFYVGQSAEETEVITEKRIYETADYSGDYDPIHTSKEYAEKRKFKARIAHSLVLDALISRLIGMKLPGGGGVFIKKSFTCLKPVILDDVITATATIEEIDEENNLMDIRIECRNQRDETVVEGKTKVLYLGDEEEDSEIVSW